MTERIVATARSYDELIAALKARVAELETTYETVEGVAGLPDRYLNKVFSPVPIKAIGRVSMGLLLGALGLKLVVMVDEEVYDRIRGRLIKKLCTSGGMPTARRPQNAPLFGDSDWSKAMNARRNLKLSPAERSRLARKAVKIRWARKRAAS